MHIIFIWIELHLPFISPFHQHTDGTLNSKTTSTQSMVLQSLCHLQSHWLCLLHQHPDYSGILRTAEIPASIPEDHNWHWNTFNGSLVLYWSRMKLHSEIVFAYIKHAGVTIFGAIIQRVKSGRLAACCTGAVSANLPVLTDSTKLLLASEMLWQ